MCSVQQFDFVMCTVGKIGLFESNFNILKFKLEFCTE